MKKRIVSIMMAVTLAAALTAGCGNSGSGQAETTQAATTAAAETEAKAQDATDAETEAAETEAAPDNSSYSGTVMLYSSMQEDQLIAVKQAFEAKYPNVTMEYYFAGTSKVVTKISTEAQAGQVDADVIWVGDASDYVSFKNEGILQKYSSPEAEQIDDAYIDPEGYYTAARLVGVGIGYNTTMVSEEEAPKTWNDLLDEKWNDQIVMSDPGTAGTTAYWMNALMCDDNYGADFMQKLHDNGCYLESGTTATHNQLAAGAYKVGVCIDYVTANLAAEGSPIAFLYPDETVVIPSPIGLVANCANEENGKLLYDFLISKEGQEVLVANNLISVRNDVDQTADVGALAAKALESDMSELVENSSKNLEEFNKMYGL